MIDLTTEFGQRVAARLAEEEVVWLTTVRADGTPQPSPVWFLWDGTALLIYSKPDTPKVRNITRHPRVALNFNSDEDGDNVVVFEGDAMVADQDPPADTVAAYIAKYREGLAGLNMTPEAFARDYSTALRVTPTKVRGF